ncbi:hypothetical protein [Endozoicomonas sp. SESOKO2]|uniref:hypothetical protein n=1 Tax=Endozoicomonas sp. SESOKO2 TaxID=2828743 RepID=UPI0021493FB6|nr:hypothetical protein [Endozoicomonas sp. SESOKO2]
MTERYIVELEQTNQHFYTERDWQKLTHDASDIAEANSYAGTHFSLDDKPHRPGDYGVKTTIIESTLWQWLYTTHLRVGYKLTLTGKDSPLSPGPYSSLPVEVIVAVGWVLKSYLNLDSLLFGLIQQLETASTQAQEGKPDLAITMMFGSGHHRTLPPSEPSGQRPSGATTHPKASFNSPLNTDYGDDKRGPQEDLHTLDLNCFVYPCRGICILRQSSDSSWLAESSLNSGQSSCPHLTNAQCLRCIGYFDPLNASDSSPLKTLDDFPANQLQCVFDRLVYPQPQGIDSNPAYGRNFSDGVALDGVALDGVALDGVASKSMDAGADYKTEAVGQAACKLIVIGEHGQRRPCEIVCKSATALSVHIRKDHSGQQTCDVPLVGEDGQPRPCGKVYKNALVLSSHKSKVHSGLKACDVSVIGEDGRLQPCGTVCQNALALRNHKGRLHTGQQTCDMLVVGNDGQSGPCGEVLRNAIELTYHKNRVHSSQQICGVMLIAKDGQQQPCGKVCKNSWRLSDHKRKEHSGQKTCDMIVVGEDGQQRPCGKLCKSSKALTDHKRNIHGGQKTCDEIMLGEDGQPQPCGKVCQNHQALSNHKKRHRKRKLADAAKYNDLSSK